MAYHNQVLQGLPVDAAGEHSIRRKEDLSFAENHYPVSIAA